MKRKIITGILMFALTVLAFGMNVNAEDTIYNGISIETVDLSGMTKDEAIAAVNNYIDGMKDETVSFVVAQNEVISTTIGQFQPTWDNKEILDEILSVANEGNVVERYKSIKDIQQNGLNYDLKITFNKNDVMDFLNEEGLKYDVEFENPSLTRENGEFKIVGGVAGSALMVDQAADMIVAELFDYYQNGDLKMELPVVDVEPAEDIAKLSAVKDILGTWTTSYSTSGLNRRTNVENGCQLVNGTTIYPGEEFSFYNEIKPFTAENGYMKAPSYMSGTVIESYGGGICQVSSTLYNAVLRAELEVTERYPHSMIVTYVAKSADAAIAENTKDFKFVNNTEYPIYIEGITNDKKVTFNIYGVETRPANRKVEYVSEQISETIPEYESIIADPGAALGSVTVTSAHIGYKAKLWKVVYEDDVEVSREQVNSSTYNASPRTARVGLLTSDSSAYDRMVSAIGTGSIDMCIATAAQILSGN